MRVAIHTRAITLLTTVITAVLSAIAAEFKPFV
jgi:hypothetical protein